MKINLFVGRMRIVFAVVWLLVAAGLCVSCSDNSQDIDNEVVDRPQDGGNDGADDGDDETDTPSDPDGSDDGDDTDEPENPDGDGDDEGDGEGEGDGDGEDEGDPEDPEEPEEPEEPETPEEPHEYRIPVVRIHTSVYRGSITKDDWVDGEIEIDGGSEFAGLALMKTQVKGRGNSTWGQKKKPYALKLDKKQEVLGMPKHKRWCLLANYMDNTHMRNRLAYHIGQNTGLAWTPRNEFAEVWFNDEYLGLYLVVEQIKVDENRVDIPELSASDISGEAVTGGYLLELDTYFDEAYKFKTTSTKMPVNLKSPDENVPAEQMKYIEDYMNSADNAFLALWLGYGTAEQVYNLVDRGSMADFWIVNEVMGNYEILHPKSTYLYKQRGGKLYAGPLWDFDYGTMRQSKTSAWMCYGLTAPTGYVEWSWYERSWWNILITKDPSFRAEIKQRWQNLYPFLQSVPAFIELDRQRLAEAVKNNDKSGWKSPGGAPNEDTGLSFDAAINQLKNTYNSRIAWLNTQISRW